MSTQQIPTPYGVFSGVTSTTSFPDGALQSVTLCEKNVVLTHAGELIPLYDPDMRRRKNKGSVSFHHNGMIKSVSLQEQQDVLTPIGEFPAELVTFYESGELNRFFVLDGQLTGFWTEEDERGHNIPLNFDLPCAQFRAMLTGAGFYKNGAIRSLTLFPGEVIAVRTKSYGELPARIGFSLSEEGGLQSFEPARPIPIRTPIGTLTAYDPEASGLNADTNSLAFDCEGRVVNLTTVSNRISVLNRSGPLESFAPPEIPSPLDPEKTILVPLKLAFHYADNTVEITDAVPHRFPLDVTFAVSPDNRPFASGCSPADCANCKLCH